MAEEDINKNSGADGDEPDGAEDDLEMTLRKGMSGKRLVLFVVLPLVLLIVSGTAVVMLSGLFSDGEKAAEEAAVAEEAPPAQVVFYELPELLVNLSSTGRRSNFLKIKVSLEIQNEADIARLDSVMPRILDNFQVYLRELRIDDLRGSAGVHRLREELLARVQTAAQPVQVNDVLFTEMLVQ